MNEEEKNFDYTMVPGKELNKVQSINDGKPLISIITGYYNSKQYIKQTAYSIINQTFPYWEWIIVNDGSTEEGTSKILDEISKLDSRIKIFNEENHGRIVTRDIAISKAQCDLIFVIDSDDVIDRTMLECCYWSMKTNPKASWVYSDMANFEGMEFLWKPAFDCSKEKKENLLSVCALIKKKDLLDVGGYGVVDDNVHEDWHLWLRMLEKGYFPIRMSYYGFWYRKKKEGGILNSINKDKKKDKYAREQIQKQAAKVKKDVQCLQFPTTTKGNFDSYPYIFDWDRKPINKKGEKIRLLFLYPWFRVGGADKFNYDLISRIDKNKFDITILTTEPCEYVWRQKFEQYAEVFDLTTFLNRQDWPAFIHYIMKSRNIDLVMISNSYFGFYVVPWLKAEFPDVIFTDYTHNENWGWRNGEYPRDSVAIDGFLDKSYTCTKRLKNTMMNEMERSIDNVETVYIGVDEKEFDSSKIDIYSNKDIEKYKDKYKGKKSILFLCRIAEEKRPIFMLRVFQELLKNDKNLLLLVVGDGDILPEMKEVAKKEQIEDNVIFFGMQPHEATKAFYKLADVTVICSLTEGLTITTYESLAMGTPVVTADVGGQKELVDSTCGAVVQNIQTDETGFYNRNYTEEEISRYVKAIERVLKDESLKNNCRNKILNGFTVDKMVEKFEDEFTKMVKNGTVVDKKTIVNKDLYKRYIVLYNQADKRVYFPQLFEKSAEASIWQDKQDARRFRFTRLKENLWRNPLWRGFIKILQKTGIMNALKKSKLKNMIKKICRI